MSEQWHYTSDEWDRSGRGRTVEFYATDEDIERYFRELPVKFAPYGIMGVASVEKDQRFESQSFLVSLEEWITKVRGAKLEMTMTYWLWSGASPQLVPNRVANWWCAVNGMINVRHGDMFNGKRAVSAIGVVDKIQNRQTGEKHLHEQQAAVYRALRKSIKRDLVYSTTHEFGDGRVAEDDCARLMTAAAAELATTGYFDRVAGRRLRA